MKTPLLTLASLMVLGAPAFAQEMNRPWQTDDGTIHFNRKTYDSWRQFHDARVYRGGRHCAAPRPNANAEAGGMLAGLNPSDCTMGSTTINPAYDPGVSDYRIPVVVHVVRNDAGTLGDLSFEMVESGIRILNEDMNALIGTPGEPGNEARIEFYLAEVDPDGNPTNGVTYTNNTTYYNDGGAYYNELGWDTERYLNIYTTTAGGALGYVAGFPADGTAGQPEDRVVVFWEAYGDDAVYGPPFDQGRTLTHEVGHYLGLFHTFQGGCDSGNCYQQSDLICDTNAVSSPNFGCDTGTQSCGSVDPIENYMDYSDDTCYNQFTPEQVNRMRCSLLNYRPLLYSLGSACSNGLAGFGAAAVQPDTVPTVSVRDCDLNLDDAVNETVQVRVYSDLDPVGFLLQLGSETPDGDLFSAPIPISSTPPAKGVQALHAPEGTSIYVAYLDELDAEENPDVEVVGSAVVDGTIDQPTGVSVSVAASFVEFTITTDEPVRVSIPWGPDCTQLTGLEVSSAFSDDQTIRIPGLEDTQSYAARLELTDQAGNTISYPSATDCIEFTLPEAPDFYTEQFTGGFDLEDTTIRFVRTGGPDVYSPCAEPASGFPVNPAGGSSLSLGDDTSSSVSLPFEFDLYGTSYDTVYVGSNGYLTFGGSDTSYTESIEAHFAFARIAPLFDDLNPSAGGTVSTVTLGDRFAVTWQNVPEYSSTNSNSFQVVLESGGDIVVTWLGIDSSDSVVGLSSGEGVDEAFEPNDLSAGQQGCLPSPPRVTDLLVNTGPGSPVEIQLLVSDDGQPGPYQVRIDSLPNGVLSDLGNSQDITSVPYLLADPLDARVLFVPQDTEYSTSFTYSADDGGVPPEGGPSDLATVEVVVTEGPGLIAGWDMNDDPQWILEGAWGWGEPTGNGGDPSAGATGRNVVGYDLNGSYGNNLPELHATTPPIDCSNATGVTVDFQQWLGVETSIYDHAYFSISNDGGATWSILYENGSTFQDTAWQLREFDVSAYADGEPDVRLRWTMGTTDSSVVYSGWNVDDVRVLGVVTGGSPTGDLNGDGLVNGADLTLLLVSWGACDGACPEDLDDDGFVTGADLTLLLVNWTG